jgi:hypothetical protein
MPGISGEGDPLNLGGGGGGGGDPPFRVVPAAVDVVCLFRSAYSGPGGGRGGGVRPFLLLAAVV